LHGGATPYRHGRYSRVARDLYMPTAQQAVRAYCVRTLATILPTMLPDRDRADEVFAELLDEAGWSPDECPKDEQGGRH
jgi:hypothetical protein